MIPLIAIILLLFFLLISGSLLVFSIAAGVTASFRGIVLYTVLALLPITLTCWLFPAFTAACLPFYPAAELVLWCVLANLAIHGLTRIFVYLYNH